MSTTNPPSIFDNAGPLLSILDYEKRSCQRLHPNWMLGPEKPNIEQLFIGLGSWATALYVCSTLALLVVAGEFIWLIYSFTENVPARRRVATVWVNSLYLVAAIMALFSILIPIASDFIWLTYRVYLGMAMCYFVNITFQWFGGETEMVNLIGKNKTINFRVRPCCCWVCCCPKETALDKAKIRLLRSCVCQMPYIQTPLIFLLVVFNLSGFSNIGNLSPTDPYLYLMSVIMISFFVGLWALFTLFGITKKYSVLSNYEYKTKRRLFKSMVIMTNVQGFIIDSLVNYNIIPCLNEEISGFAMGCILKSGLTMIQSIIIGSITTRLYMIDNSHV